MSADNFQRIHDDLPHKIFLFESNRRPEDAAFLNQLMEAQKNPNYTFVGTMTEIEKSSQKWVGETGYITKPMLGEYIGDLTLPIYYIAGPAAMVSAMRKTLNEAGWTMTNRGIFRLLSRASGGEMTSRSETVSRTDPIVACRET